MIHRNLPIPGLMLIEPKEFHDDRGFFVERYNQETFLKEGFDENFIQDNFSRSLPGVLRGLHYQFDQPQGKLVTCTRGRIFDIVVDLRHTEPSFGKNFGIELNGTKSLALWIPPGFAHGFCVLGQEPADVLYKVNSIYNAKGEYGLKWNDPELQINWPTRTPVVSAKDEVAPGLKDYLSSRLAQTQWWKPGTDF